jgi:AAA ATPase domain
MSAHNTLRGREAECAALDVLLDAARSGESRTVVLRGEAGVGKTALLDYAIGSAQDFRVLRSVGVESEMELVFVSLHQLCAPVMDRRGSLPGPQREALEVVFGLDSGPAPDRFLVGLATLSLLAEIANEQPLLCVIDDAQWLDSASALAFALVARRLLAEPIGLLFAVREPIEVRELAGLPELMVGGLSEDDAGMLLGSALPGRLDERVRNRIVAEARGNPLALLELPRGLTPGELAGGFAVPDARPLADRIERSFLRQVRSLPPDAQRLLATAAAEPVGDVTLLWRAAERLGSDPTRSRPPKRPG